MQTNQRCLQDLEGPLDLTGRPSNYPSVYKWAGEMTHPLLRLGDKGGDTYILFNTASNQYASSQLISTGRESVGEISGVRAISFTSASKH